MSSALKDNFGLAFSSANAVCSPRHFSPGCRPWSTAPFPRCMDIRGPSRTPLPIANLQPPPSGLTMASSQDPSSHDRAPPRSGFFWDGQTVTSRDCTFPFHPDQKVTNCRPSRKSNRRRQPNRNPELGMYIEINQFIYELFYYHIYIYNIVVHAIAKAGNAVAARGFCIGGFGRNTYGNKPIQRQHNPIWMFTSVQQKMEC